MDLLLSPLHKGEPELQFFESEYSADGLKAIAGEVKHQISLAKSLAERIAASNVRRKRPKLKGGTKRKLSAKLDQLLADIVNATAHQLIADTLAEMPISATESIPSFVGLLIVPQGVLRPHLQRP